jgi:hypothetical protein
MKELKKLITQAVALDREINQKTELLKSFKMLLIKAAQRQKKQLQRTENGGLRWSAEGEDGTLARVNFPAPSLTAKIDAEDECFSEIKALAGKAFRHLFKPSKCYKLIAGFRSDAGGLLNPTAAKKLIALCENESKPRVSFETARRESQASTAANEAAK